MIHLDTMCTAYMLGEIRLAGSQLSSLERSRYKGLAIAATDLHPQMRYQRCYSIHHNRIFLPTEAIPGGVSHDMQYIVT